MAAAVTVAVSPSLFITVPGLQRRRRRVEGGARVAVCGGARSQQQGLFGGFFKGKNDGKQQRSKTSPPDVGLLQPQYTVLKADDKYEVRMYTAHVVVETEYERRPDGYLALGEYAGGENAEGVKLIDTAPVTMDYPASSQGAKTMSLYARRRDSDKMPPLPLNPALQLRIAGGEAGKEGHQACTCAMQINTFTLITLMLCLTVAVLPFTGNATPAAAASARSELVKLLSRDGVALAEEYRDGAFCIAQYGPIYALLQRVNELHLKVDL
eukprot:jgi/Chlat1/118/Chrsp1S03207